MSRDSIDGSLYLWITRETERIYCRWVLSWKKQHPLPVFEAHHSPADHRPGFYWTDNAKYEKNLINRQIFTPDSMFSMSSDWDRMPWDAVKTKTKKKGKGEEKKGKQMHKMKNKAQQLTKARVMDSNSDDNKTKRKLAGCCLFVCYIKSHSMHENQDGKW